MSSDCTTPTSRFSCASSDDDNSNNTTKDNHCIDIIGLDNDDDDSVFHPHQKLNSHLYQHQSAGGRVSNYADGRQKIIGQSETSGNLADGRQTLLIHSGFHVSHSEIQGPNFEDNRQRLLEGVELGHFEENESEDLQHSDSIGTHRRGSSHSSLRGLSNDELQELRSKINMRERKRMHDLNSAMDSLRDVMPYAKGPSVRKLSKIATLTLARNYIQMLNKSVEEMKQLLEDIYRSGAPMQRHGAVATGPAASPYFSAAAAVAAAAAHHPFHPHPHPASISSLSQIAVTSAPSHRPPPTFAVYSGTARHQVYPGVPCCTLSTLSYPQPHHVTSPLTSAMTSQAEAVAALTYKRSEHGQHL